MLYILKIRFTKNSQKRIVVMKFIFVIFFLDQAYMDSPQTIGYQATISAPHMHADALERLKEPLINKNDNISALDVGSGSGYICACLARIIGILQFKLLLYSLFDKYELFN